MPGLPTALPFPTLPVIPAPTYSYNLVPLPQAPVPNQVVIAFRPGTSAAERAAYVESLGGEIKQSIDALNTVVIEVPARQADTPLAASNLVITSEPDYYASAQIAVPPSDPFYGQQWALSAIGAPQTWLALPADTPKVVVAVIDSGARLASTDLQGRLLPGWDFVQNDSQPQDDFGHGCGVAGIIAANADDAIGMATPEVTLTPTEVVMMATPTLTMPATLPTVTATLPPTLELTTLPTALLFPTMDDDTPLWQATSGWPLSAETAFNAGGLGWMTTASGQLETLTLRVPVALGAAVTPHLSFQSNLASASLPEVQLSLDGANWQTLAVVPPSADWTEARVDLSASRGQTVYLQFVWLALLPVEGQALDTWQLDEVTLALWLIVKGFKPSATASESAKPAANALPRAA